MESRDTTRFTWWLSGLRKTLGVRCLARGLAHRGLRRLRTLLPGCPGELAPQASPSSDAGTLATGIYWKGCVELCPPERRLGHGEKAFLKSRGQPTISAFPACRRALESQLPPTCGLSVSLYREPARKHPTHRNSRAPSSRACRCGSGSPGGCLLHH